MNIGCGQCSPLGASVSAAGVNIAVQCSEANRVYLCLFNPDTEETIAEFPLPAKTGQVYHGLFDLSIKNQLYALRIESEQNEDRNYKLVMDPYAKCINRPFVYDSRLLESDNHLLMPKASIIDDAELLRERPSKPCINAKDRIIYETHVKGLTQLNPEVPDELRGKYEGAAHPSVINHLKQLGITTVQFMPLFAYMPEAFISEKGLTNYWGYNPVNFYSPEPRYSRNNAYHELRTMVDTYHDEGIECIVDVVFNHTAEADQTGADLCLRPLLGSSVYRHVLDSKHQSKYANYSGCGNTLNLQHPFVYQYILDAMRFWLDDIGFDGFRFDLAPVIGREAQQFNADASLFRAMKQDPVINRGLLIAEPWDLGPNGYQLGHFSAPWLEVNDKFRDTVRGFWRGDEGLLADFATRIMGSSDKFNKQTRDVHSSVNCITYHDGFTLHDLVTYSDKHNHANGEDNRDGHSHNLSSNYGKEGESKDAGLIAYREKQKRNMFATLLLSRGTPHLLGGDELSRTQFGNNNAYCQDNSISWFNWDLNSRQQDFLDFCRYVITLRRKSELLGNLRLDDDTYSHQTNVEKINWYKPDGSDKASADWQQKNIRAFACDIVGQCKSKGDTPERWLLCVNASDDDVRFHLPDAERYQGWRLRLDTRYTSLAEQPDVCVHSVFLQRGKSIALFSFEKNTHH